MFAFKIVIFYLPFSIFLEPIEGLVELPVVEDNDIEKAEAIIRATTNKLFSSLKLKGAKNNTRVSHSALVHNYLVTLTLRDYNSLKEIAKLTRVDKSNINHGMRSFMGLLNEVINEETEVETKSVKASDVVNYNLKNFYNALNLNDDQPTELMKLLQEWNIPLDTLTDSSTSSDNDDVIFKEIEVWDNMGSDTRRIFRGKRTKIKEFPFMASVEIFNRFTCAGSIIEDDLIITAASCLQLAWNNRFYRENPAFLSVRVGSHFFESGGENIEVLEIYFHPSYDPKLLLNNIAIMRLVRKIRFRRKRKRVKKIKIDTAASKLPVNTDGITIVGWGAKGIDNIVHNPYENKLSFAVLDIYPLEDCRDIYSKIYVTHKHFCAGFISKGYGACNRDVGGPGVVDGLLTGIISFGSPICGKPDTPTVFTKVGWYADWIEEIMEQKVPQSRKRTTLKTSPIYSYMFTDHAKLPLMIDKMTARPWTTKTSRPILEKEIETIFNSDEWDEYLDILRRPAPSAFTKHIVHASSKTRATTTVPERIEYIPSTQMFNEEPTILTESSEEEKDFDNCTEIMWETMKTTKKPKKSKSTKGKAKKLKQISKSKVKELHNDKTDLVYTKPWKVEMDYSKKKVNTSETDDSDDSIVHLLISDEEKSADEIVADQDSLVAKNLPIDDDEGGEIFDLESLMIEDYNETRISDKKFKDFTYRNKNKNIIDDAKKKRAKEIVNGFISEKTLFEILVEYLRENNKLKEAENT